MSTLFPDLLTNVEKKVGAYARKDQPTDPRQVGPETPLSKLNLNWRERDLPERERTKHVHRLHPYLGKFIPQLVEIFLRKYFKAGQTVLDPFCGCGTTLVQANELGVNSVGYDISIFNVLLCTAKTQKYDVQQVRRELLDIVESVDTIAPARSNQRRLWEEVRERLALSEPDTEYLRKWYAPQAMRELMAYRRFIDARDYKYKDLMRVVLSRSARSARMTTHFELDFPKKPQTEPYWCHKHSRTCVPTTDAGKFLRRYTLDTIRRVQEFGKLRTTARVRVVHGDSRAARFPKIDGVLTSPPYVGLIDYHEQHSYAYHLLGLEDARDKEIGPASDGYAEAARERYMNDVTAVFARCLQAMPKHCPLVVIAADRHHLYPRIARMLGVAVEGVVERHVNRRTGMRSTEFFESIFVWRKR